LKGYKIRKGDMITAGPRAAVVTKVTPKYVYYFLGGHINRSKKETLWSNFDNKSSEVSIAYGSKKRRRVQNKMRSLDLHGVKHLNVEEEVKNFLNFVELPCKIITGNSDQMKYLVDRIVKEYGWHCGIENVHNPGTLMVVER
tara:strand:- start:2817 stop:3242 length:426 start_codon:yes stop_codon:yes gene_type:complete